MKKMKIIGKEYNVAFNFATEMEYYSIAGKNLEGKDIFGDENTEVSPISVGNLVKAVIKANNKDADVEELIHEASRTEMEELVSACVMAMLEWMSTPNGAEDHVDVAEDSVIEEDDEKKV